MAREDPATVDTLAAVIRRARAATLRALAKECEPDLDEPNATHRELSYREGQVSLTPQHGHLT